MKLGGVTCVRKNVTTIQSVNVCVYIAVYQGVCSSVCKPSPSCVRVLSVQESIRVIGVVKRVCVYVVY